MERRPRFVNFGKIFIENYCKIKIKKKGGVGIGGEVKDGARP